MYHAQQLYTNNQFVKMTPISECMRCEVKKKKNGKKKNTHLCERQMGEGREISSSLFENTILPPPTANYIICFDRLTTVTISNKMFFFFHYYVRWSVDYYVRGPRTPPPPLSSAMRNWTCVKSSRALNDYKLGPIIFVHILCTTHRYIYIYMYMYIVIYTFFFFFQSAQV